MEFNQLPMDRSNHLDNEKCFLPSDEEARSFKPVNTSINPSPVEEVNRFNQWKDNARTFFGENPRNNYGHKPISLKSGGNLKKLVRGRTDELTSRFPEDQTADQQKLREETTDIDKKALPKENKPTGSPQPERNVVERCRELEDMVSSGEVVHAIVRVIEHFSSTNEKQESRLDIEEVRSSLSSIRFFTDSQTSRQAKYRGRMIQDRDVSSTQWAGFTGGNTSEIHEIVLHELDCDIKDSFIDECVRVCRECIPMPRGAEEFLRAIFNLAYDKKPIEDYLNLPTVGSYIPVELHSSLDQNPRDFKAGKYLAYEVFDPVLSDEEGDAVYVVARIIAMIGETTDNLWRRKYRIDIGEIAEVPGADLYAFLGKLHTLITGIDPETDPGSAEDRKSVQEVKSEIDRQLKEAWDMDETIGKKAAKRLFLKWHRAENPDKFKVVEHICKFVKQSEYRTKKAPNFCKLF